jgi:hypothetical protein
VTCAVVPLDLHAMRTSPDMPQSPAAWVALLVGGAISQVIAGAVTEAVLAGPSTWAMRSAVRLAVFVPPFLASLAIVRKINAKASTTR